MFNISDIREHAEVIGSDGRHVGTVDRVEGDRIKLTKSENGAGHEGHHHFIPFHDIDSIEGGRIKLAIASDDAINEEEEGDGAPVH